MVAKSFFVGTKTGAFGFKQFDDNIDDSARMLSFEADKLSETTGWISEI